MTREKKVFIKLSLKAARVNSNLYQKEAAYKLGVEEGTIRNWEKGRTQPTTLYVDKILELYHLKYEDIDWDNN